MESVSVIGSKRVLIENSDGTRKITPAILSISQNHFVEISECKSDELDFLLQQKGTLPGCKSVNFGDRLISPTFINAHTHLPMSFFRGFSKEDCTRNNMIEDLFFHVESRLTPEDVLAFSRMGAYECLLSGVGFVWDHYYFGNAVAQALAETGLAGTVAPTLQDLAGPGVPWLEQQFADTVAVATSEKFASHGVFAALGPHATDTVSASLWRRVVDFSQKYMIPIHAHVAQSAEEFRRISEREGCSPLEFLNRNGILSDSVGTLLVHGIYLSKEDLKKIPKDKSALVFCPFSQMIFNFPAQVMEWEKEGLGWCVATDCVASNDSMNVQKELRYIAGLPNAATTHSVAFQSFLANGTTNDVEKCAEFRSQQQDLSMRFSAPNFLLDKVFSSARNLHPSVKVGAIARDFLANIIVWEQDHPAFWPGKQPMRGLAMGDTTQAIHAMMVAGNWVGQIGNFQQSLLASPEYQEAIREATERLQLLRKRA